MNKKQKQKFVWVFVYIATLTICSFFITYAFIGNDLLKLSKQNTQIKENIQAIERTQTK